MMMLICFLEKKQKKIFGICIKAKGDLRIMTNRLIKLPIPDLHTYKHVKISKSFPKLE